MKSWPLLLLLIACSEAKSPYNKELAKDTPVAADRLPQAARDSASAKTESELGDLGYGDDAKLFSSAGDAVIHILNSHPGGQARVLGFGEFHKLTSSAPVRSALRRFGDDIVDRLGLLSSDLILESWSVNPQCGKSAEVVTEKVQKTIERPAETESEMDRLARKIKRYGIRGHLLAFECNEYSALLEKGELDHNKLLGAVTRKLRSSTELVIPHLTKDKFAIVYGGSTHNDLFPYKGLESWSYAPDIAKTTQGGFIEIDLYVPEFIQDDKLLKTEAWYPLLKEARTDQVILIRRDPRSYIVIMRKGLSE